MYIPLSVCMYVLHMIHIHTKVSVFFYTMKCGRVLYRALYIDSLYNF